MKEKLIYQTTDKNIEAIIDRETGAIDIFNNCLKLNIKDNTTNLVEVENGKEKLICAGYRFMGNWYFKELDLVQKDQDPFMAVVKLFYEVFLIRVKKDVYLVKGLINTDILPSVPKRN